MRWMMLVFALYSALEIPVSIAGITRMIQEGKSPVLAIVWMLVSLVLAGLFGFLFMRATQAEKNNEQANAWLHANASEILKGGAVYNGETITRDTKMSCYLYTFSIVVMTFKRPSAFFLRTGDGSDAKFAGIVNSLGTVVLGWWGIPWGPIYTIQSLAKNAGGGYQVSVGSYLADQGLA